MSVGLLTPFVSAWAMDKRQVVSVRKVDDSAERIGAIL